MQNQNNETSNTFTKKIGAVMYKVEVYFSQNSKENFNDKLMRVIKNDIANGVK